MKAVIMILKKKIDVEVKYWYNLSNIKIKVSQSKELLKSLQSTCEMLLSEKPS